MVSKRTSTPLVSVSELTNFRNIVLRTPSVNKVKPTFTQRKLTVGLVSSIDRVSKIYSNPHPSSLKVIETIKANLAKRKLKQMN